MVFYNSSDFFQKQVYYSSDFFQNILKFLDNQKKKYYIALHSKYLVQEGITFVDAYW